MTATEPASGSNHPPRIGITTYLERARWGVWDRMAALLPAAYLEAVAGAGGVAVLLSPRPEGAAASPPRPDSAAASPGRLEGEEARAAVDAVDGLILAGGADVDPAGYAAAAHERTGPTQPQRDRWELALLRAALDRDLPVLALCRGAQLLNVAFGGTLHQHLPEVVGHDSHRPEPGVFGTSTVSFARGGRLGKLLGAELKVPCHHHQGLARLGEGVVAVGWAADGTVEAVELPDRRFVVGVQWHPEEDGADRRLFAAFVRAAAAAHS